jgi:hypothetical protein
LEASRFDREKMLDVDTAGKDTFKIDPLSLDVDPDI